MCSHSVLPQGIVDVFSSCNYEFQFAWQHFDVFCVRNSGTKNDRKTTKSFFFLTYLASWQHLILALWQLQNTRIAELHG